MANEDDRQRYQEKVAKEAAWLEENNLTESLARGLEQSAKDETESLGSFVKYLEQDEPCKECLDMLDTLKADEKAHEDYYAGNPLGLSPYVDKYEPGYAADHTDNF